MNRDNKNAETKQCTIPSVIGSISIHRYGRLTQRAIKSKTKWFDECEYYTIEADEECIIITKCRMEIQKKAHRYTKGTGLKVEMDLPYGNFVFDDEESTEDELVVYYR